MWDLGSLIRDGTQVPCIQRQTVNHWTTREVPYIISFHHQKFLRDRELLYSPKMGPKRQTWLYDTLGPERRTLGGWERKQHSAWEWESWRFNCCCWVAKSGLTLCDPMGCSTPIFPVLHHLPELAQNHVHWVGNAIQPSYPLSPSSALAFNLSQPRGLFKWVSSSCQVAKISEFQLQHQSFQWIFRADFL